MSIREPIMTTCQKCSDRYTVSFGGWSVRNSCRQHTYVEGKDRCVDCFNDKPGANCYHKPQLSCWGKCYKFFKKILTK